MIKTAYIKFFAAVDQDTMKQLMTAVEQKLMQGTAKFVLLISSGGGKVDAGITAYNFLKGIPAEVHTHNFGNASSTALVLYCAGRKRLSVPHAKFLLHGVTSKFAKDTAMEENRLLEKLESLRMSTENIDGIVAATTGKSEKSVIDDMRKRTILNPEQAVDYGLVHEIVEPLFGKGADLISIQ